MALIKKYSTKNGDILLNEKIIVPRSVLIQAMKEVYEPFNKNNRCKIIYNRTAKYGSIVYNNSYTEDYYVRECDRKELRSDELSRVCPNCGRLTDIEFKEGSYGRK